MSVEELIGRLRELDYGAAVFVNDEPLASIEVIEENDDGDNAIVMLWGEKHS